MEYKLKEIARRIADLREIVGYSVEEMAQKTGVTPEEYKTLELGEKDFSFTFIYKCAMAFNVEVADIVEGTSPTLSGYSVTRKGDGMPIVRRKGFVYNNQAPFFKNKMAEPFVVKAPFTPKEQNEPIHLSSHKGQEFDLIIKGKLKVQIGEHVEVLNEGDSIFYDSSTPHGMIAIEGKSCEFLAVVLNPKGDPFEYNESAHMEKGAEIDRHVSDIVNPSDKFIETETDEQGVLKKITFHNEDKFNFAFDVVDELGKKYPDRLAMLHVDREGNDRRFTFSDISKYSSKTANYFKKLGIKKGDRVMLVLRRNYQFWFSIVALHKLGAVTIPATDLLVKHDFEYRFEAGKVNAIVCTSYGDVSNQVDLAHENFKDVIKIIAGGKKDSWNDFDSEIELCSDVFERTEESAAGDDPAVMFFTSGTTGYPKIATHSHKYGLGHYVTARYWQNVNPDGIHCTISDTGWGKALWGKLYGQWLCGAAIFTYDFDKFISKDILPMFAKYHITTFCAPPTMFRFFIKEDLSQYDLSSIEYATVAGEALNPEVYNQFLKATGVKLMEGFGQTETTLTVGNLVGMTPKLGSMGKPNPLYDIDIVNPDGTSTKTGETGEIVVRTDKSKPCGLFLGYFLNEEKTKEAWHDDMYHTGDTAWRDEDGYYFYVGRVDDLIKSSGYRIGPFEIESVIMELPYVLECAVTAAPDEIRGQVVKASVVLVNGKEGTEELKKEIQNYVKKKTAPYKYPRIVEFLDELPKTISGKVRRVELREKSK
ncbi:MAG: AMP-binding protein [Bacillota bacterium]|nr:AMP-binding protein [Bacillota bacterium]